MCTWFTREAEVTAASTTFSTSHHPESPGGAPCLRANSKQPLCADTKTRSPMKGLRSSSANVRDDMFSVQFFYTGYCRNSEELASTK